METKKAARSNYLAVKPNLLPVYFPITILQTCMDVSSNDFYVILFNAQHKA